MGPFADVMRGNVALMEPHYTPSEVLLSQESEQSLHCGVEYASQDAFTVNTMYVYSRDYFVIMTLVTSDQTWQAADIRLMQKKWENVQVKEREVLW